jgi:hypothetical protein
VGVIIGPEETLVFELELLAIVEPDIGRREQARVGEAGARAALTECVAGKS